jgi:deoxyribodipyrimidine photo-lyase
MRTLMWFRSDLRVRDNTALDEACRAADKGVVAVFALCPRQWAEHDWGGAKVDFVLRNVRSLSASLADINVPLLLVRAERFGQLPQKLLQVASRHGCDALYFNVEHEVNELRRDREVGALFERSGRAVHAFDDQTILDVSRIRTGSGHWYRVFTPFRRKWHELLEEQGPPKIRRRPRRQESLGIRSDPVPEALDGFEGASSPELWPAGEHEASKRLRAFASGPLGEYHRTRDSPAQDGTSRLSPYLAAGVLSARQCFAAAVDANDGRVEQGRKGAVTWIVELIWREFYRHVLIGFPRVSMNRPFRPETDQLPWRCDEATFEAWCAGRTGVPIVDAGMRQLREQGWMHNRLRMIVAMFVTKELFIDWRWGERHFMRHLVDGDLASNNGGWQWSASTGTDAVPYFRIFNPFSQSRRFDPQGEFIRRFVPELSELSAGEIHEPGDKALRGLDYPSPIVDRAAARERVLEAFRGLSGEGDR